jgi:hypothetical protein
MIIAYSRINRGIALYTLDMKTETEKKPVDLTRRRLAKGSLAAPIVLATLTSKNVLAAAPYQCTISGQLSGNASPNGPADSTQCNMLGLGESAREGTISNAPHNLGSRTLADLSLTSAYNYKNDQGTGTIVTAATNGSQPATIFEMLTCAAPSNPPNFDYAKKALVLYLNAEDPNFMQYYPLTTAQARVIFNTIVAGADYPGPPSLSNSLLKSYIDLLYHP